MGLLYDVGRWPEHLWSSHVQTFPSARAVLDNGTQRQPQFPGFASDMHSSLYCRHLSDLQAEAPAWARELLTTATELPEFQRLRQRCQHNGFLAGIAAESLLSTLLPMVPQAEEKARQEPAQQPPGHAAGEGQANGQGPAQHAPQGRPSAQGDAAAADQRRQIRQACREAAHTVDQAGQATDALQQALGRQQGQGPGTQESLKDLDDVRRLYALLRDNPTLRHIAALAGRLHRLGQAHKKARFEPAVGTVKGITLGGDLERVLPSELAGLRSANKLLRLRTLERLMSRKALQYLWRGEESLTRGPLIVLVDESGSMGHGPGSAGAWSKAVCLALMTQAIDQHRAFHLVGFSGHRSSASWREAINHEFHCDAGSSPPSEAVCTALLRGCDGGTSFNAPLRRALEVLQDTPTMRQADIVLITDGEATIADDVQQAVLAVRAREGVQLYGVLVGADARGNTLQPIATALWHVSQQLDGAVVAPLLAQVS